MERRAKLFLAVAAIVASGVAFVARERGKARSKSGYESNIKEARISFEDFVGTRLKHGKVIGEIRARSGYLLEPNMIEFFGNVSLKRPSSTNQTALERLNCETAAAYFLSNNLAQMVNSSALDRVELRGFVKLQTADVKLETDSAVFYRKSGQLVSFDPVLVIGAGQEFRGDGGFEFDATKEDLHVLGPVRGGGLIATP